MPNGPDDCVEVAVGQREECAREEDQGYDRCSEREDQGYSECCDWWPCSWACDAWVWVSHWVCVAYVWVSNMVCVAWTLVTEFACIAIEVINAALGPMLGVSHISDSTLDRSVNGVSKTYTDSRSFASTINYDDVAERFKYRDGGKYLQFKINGNDVLWNDEFPSDTFRLFAPSEQVLNSPSELEGNALAVSYDDKRLGDWTEAPYFEMIVASSDRVFAKVTGVDSFYIAIPTHLYLHKTSAGDRIILPQSFFKNDPELGLPDEQLDDLLFHIAVSEDDEIHPATERFPLYRALYGLMESPLENVEFFRSLFAVMDVQVQPLTWVRMDTRPSRGSKDVPSIYPLYKHVTYRRDGVFGYYWEDDKFSIKFNKVLDIGVGLSHLNEQYEPIYGGELDVIDNNTGIWWLTFEELYRLANGPIQDIGGWVDGTCIYYLLVRLPFLEQDDLDRLNSLLESHDETDIENDAFRNRYAVLWVDEQQAFTERWRALDFLETEYESPVKPVSALVKNAEEYDFHTSRFLNPFKEGFIRPFSQMAVARQVVIVNGYTRRKDQPGKHYLYSINFSWPTMDRSWRRRGLPPNVSVRLLPRGISELEYEQHMDATVDSIYPQTLRLREDMTIHLRGTMLVNDSLLKGRWVQKYLPADGQGVPSENTLQHGSKEERDEASYTHAWQFYEEETFLKMHQMYSHFGVYECVDSRCQFYKIEILSHKNVSMETVPDLTWIDTEKALKVDRWEINYKNAGAVLDMALGTIPLTTLVAVVVGLATQSVVAALIAFFVFILIELGISLFVIFESKSFTSLYEDRLRFKIVDTAALGHLMFYFDKREDKTVGFDNLPVELTLKAEEDKSQSIRISVDEFVRSKRHIGTRERISPPEVADATIKVFVNDQNQPQKVEFNFTSARNPNEFDSDQDFEDWIALNIDQMKLGVPESSAGSNIIFETKRAGRISRIDTSNEFSCEWTPASTDPYYDDLLSLLTDNRKITSGISLWFISITGQVNIAEHLHFTRENI